MKESLKKINHIIEKDSKDTTYKFALLRGAIDICINYDHLGVEDQDFVYFPMSLMIERWILYYYPLIEKEIPQKSGTRKLSFYKHFKNIVDFYRTRGGYGSFYVELVKNRIPAEIKDDYKKLVKTLKNTISNMPMRYLGKSYYKDEYRVFRYRDNKDRDKHGEFGLLKEFYEVFRYIGTFISGYEAIIYKWAEFSSNASRGQVSKSEVIETLLTEPEYTRDTRLIRDILAGEETLVCTWTGNKINKKDLHIDHIIPFSIWSNNSMWNLVPTSSKVNQSKRDKIPSKGLLDDRRENIKRYWKLYMEKEPVLFIKEMNRDLLGNKEQSLEDKDLDIAIDLLKSKIEYLINDRGYEEWNP